MKLDFDTVQFFQREHPSWRLLRSGLAPLVVSFFDRVFIQPTVRSITETNLAEALEDHLFSLRDRAGADKAERA